MFSQSTMIKYDELKLEKKLGEGGYGVIYQGTYRHNDVAVKKLLTDTISPEAAKEFEQESQIMARLHSPNIVQFYGFCMSPTYCLVMEYMPNGSLFNVLRSNKPLDWPVRFRIAIDIAKGLAFLHHENILHRDIKSLNVLLGENYQAKLTDFGLSKVKAETKSHSMAMKTAKESVGTIAWMAPELFSRKAVYTQKSDIYSLGITFWELASRKIPFADAQSQDLIPAWIKEGEREDIPKDCPLALAQLIQKCWAGDSSQRPDADAVVTLLKSSIEPTTDSAINSEPKYQADFNSSPTSSLHYKGNLDSEIPASPLLFSEKFSNLNLLPKQSSIVDAKELGKFLRLVVGGQQEEAEVMLKKNRELALGAGDVTDHANRIFSGITGFQYAVWALDWHMWKMIRKYLADDAAREQAKGFTEGSWVKEHGKYVSWQKLLDALQTFIDNCEKWGIKKCNKYWVQQIGGAQFILPMHVLQEYCQPDRPFEPCPNFKEEIMLIRKLPNWLNKVVDSDLAKHFAISRGEESDGANAREEEIEREAWEYYKNEIEFDLYALESLSNTRTQQRDELVAELKNASKESVFPELAQQMEQLEAISMEQQKFLQKEGDIQENKSREAFLPSFGQRQLVPISSNKSTSHYTAEELSTFLNWVVAGQQDEAEEMVKKNPGLALGAGDVTDLSGRTFKNITGFQYAVWALDWHMWEMIQKYLSEPAIKEQTMGYDKGPWVKQYGVSANWQNLVDALGKQIKLLQDKKWAEAEKHWEQTVGGAQRLVPAHVVNEYCHPSRSFNPCPDFTQGAKLPRVRQIDKGDWFTASYNGGKLGEKFAVIRGASGEAHFRRRKYWMLPGAMAIVPVYLGQDREACRALLATRTELRDQLLLRYSPEKRVAMKRV